MSANRFNQFSTLGAGIGLRVPHYDHILSRRPKVDFFEIIAENFLVDGGRPREVLDAILELYPVILHGVSLYFGSVDKPSREHLSRLKKLVRLTGTPWMADHLCWGSVDGRYTHDLLPLPYTKQVARIAAEKIRHVQDVLEIPIAVENLSSYAEFKESTMTEWEFLGEVVDKANCGILLDVNNIYVSSQNHGFDPYRYVSEVPFERVAQIHIAGHTKRDDIIIDTHDRAPISEVWKLYRYALTRVGHTPTLLEWDASIPSFDEVRREAQKAERYLEAQREVPVRQRVQNG
jgi:uncharacterized protein (UPF0276 family)